jgi:hypothetical protein
VKCCGRLRSQLQRGRRRSPRGEHCESRDQRALGILEGPGQRVGIQRCVGPCSTPETPAASTTSGLDRASARRVTPDRVLPLPVSNSQA